MKVIAAFTAGATVTDAARQAGVDRTTIHRWLKNPRFVAEWNRSKCELRERMHAECQAMIPDAIRTVRELVTGTDLPPAIRLKAAMFVLHKAGLLEPEEIGPTTPESVRAKWAEAEIDERLGPI